MILIADGGSTKCDWALLDKSGQLVYKTTTKGINPNITTPEEIRLRIESNENLQNVFDKVGELYFYGAGCGALQSRNTLEKVLESLFVDAHLSVREDTVGAVRAVTSAPGIVCILGTGSNSCYFDGQEIHHPIPSLGYVMMDEAAANYFGKQLLNDYFYNRMPAAIAAAFSESYNLTPDEILFNLYKKPFPGVYLAGFSKFIFSESRDFIDEPYFSEMIANGINQFIENRILTFSNAHEVPIHFVGSIAYFSQPIIQECFRKYGLRLGNMVRFPIDGLIAYYQN